MQPQADIPQSAPSRRDTFSVSIIPPFQSAPSIPTVKDIGTDGAAPSGRTIVIVLALIFVVGVVSCAPTIKRIYDEIDVGAEGTADVGNSDITSEPNHNVASARHDHGHHHHHHQREPVTGNKKPLDKERRYYSHGMMQRLTEETMKRVKRAINKV